MNYYRKEKGTKTIKITEEVQLPGTNVVLEKGDKVKVVERKESVIVNFPFYLESEDRRYFDEVKKVIKDVTGIMASYRILDEEEKQGLRRDGYVIDYRSKLYLAMFYV